MNENLERFRAMCMGVWIVNTDRVNVQDLCASRPGQIVRTTDVNAIRFIPAYDDPIGCIAGWISDE